MLSDLSAIYAKASGVAHDTNSHDAGLRAVEAAVRADCMTIEEHAALCGQIELLTEALAAAQAVKGQIEDELNGAVMLHGYEATIPAMRIAELLSRSPVDALVAHDREVAAKAWDEGALWAAVECGSIDSEANAWLAPGDNPYRTALGVPEEAEHG